MSLFLLGLGSFMYFGLLPEAERNKIQRQSAHEASLEGPKVLAELLADVRLLRLAVEKLAGQE